jgi:hypothetical protein
MPDTVGTLLAALVGAVIGSVGASLSSGGFRLEQKDRASARSSFSGICISFRTPSSRSGIAWSTLRRGAGAG